MKPPAQKLQGRRKKPFNFIDKSPSHTAPNTFTRVNGDVISKKEETILRESETEFKRRGNFSLIFPAPASNTYKTYFEESRPLNNLLYRRCLEKGLFN